MNQLQQVQVKEPVSGWTTEQSDLIRRTMAPGATPDELKLFLYTAQRAGLDPLARQIYFQKISGRPVFITSIDGLRLIASRSGQHAGTDDALFETDDHLPVRATVTVWKIVNNSKHSFTASARWDEYCPPKGRDHMWQKMPYTMLAKCAEALALRKGFPAELSGLYSNEEMDQSNVVQQEVTTPPTIVNNSLQSAPVPPVVAPPQRVNDVPHPIYGSVGSEFPDDTTLPVLEDEPEPKTRKELGEFIIPFGRWKGERFNQHADSDLRAWGKFLVDAAEKKGGIPEHHKKVLDLLKKYLDAPLDDVQL